MATTGICLRQGNMRLAATKRGGHDRVIWKQKLRRKFCRLFSGCLSRSQNSAGRCLEILFNPTTFGTLTKGAFKWIMFLPTRGGVLVSTLQIRQRRHAEDGSLAS